MSSVRDVAEALVRILDSGSQAALATVIKTAGSTPQQPGARLLLDSTGVQVGTVGGGAIEQAVLSELDACIRDGRPRVMVRDLSRDLGMCCGGRMEVFVEAIEAQPRLVLFGAGHVAAPTANMAQQVGFSVTVVDDREELNTVQRFPGCDRVLLEPAEAMRELAVNGATWVVIATHDHRLDEEALDVCTRGGHRYIGMIGSKRKVFRVLSRIHARRGETALDRVYAPVGLEIGAVTPAEIAVSIVGELVALRHGAPARHMRAIHDPAFVRLIQAERGFEPNAP